SLRILSSIAVERQRHDGSCKQHFLHQINLIRVGSVLLSIEQRCNRSRQSGSCGWDKAHTKSAALYTGNAETETTPLATPPGVQQVRGNVASPRFARGYLQSSERRSGKAEAAEKAECTSST